MKCQRPCSILVSAALALGRSWCFRRGVFEMYLSTTAKLDVAEIGAREMDREQSAAGERQEWRWRIGASACGALLLVIAAGSCSKLSVTSSELQASDTVCSLFIVREYSF